jgi:hypothetical protein
MLHRWVQTTLLVVGIACLVVFFSVNGEYRNTPDGEWLSRWVIGFNPSPWFVYKRTPHGVDMGVRIISASWLFAAGAWLALWSRKRTAPVGSASQPQEKESHAESGK